jgi:AcrR family transcriptional regulator
MGIDERKEKVRDIRKNDIIDAAERVFFSAGYDKATMDDVAREAEFSKRTIYTYFTSKEEIYFEIMIRGYRLLNSNIYRELDKSEDTPEEKIRKIAGAIYEFSKEHTKYYNSIIEYENGDKDFQELATGSSVQECYRQGEIALGFLTGVLEEGTRTGAIELKTDVKTASLFLWAASAGLISMTHKKAKYLINYHKKDPDALMEEAINLLLDSIKKK